MSQDENSVQQNLNEPYKMKIYTEYNIVTWPRIVKFTVLNIIEIQFVNVSGPNTT